MPSSPKNRSSDAAEPGKIKDIGSLARLLSVEKSGSMLNLQAMAHRRAAKDNRISYTISDSSEQVEQLPYSPHRPHATWSPRAVAQGAMEFLDNQSPTGSPIRRLCKESVEKGLPVKAVIHHIDVDPDLVKKSRNDTTLPTVTTVSRRTQRALSSEEVAENCEKSIAFFRKNRETNARLQEQAKKGGAWSKLRKKFMGLKIDGPVSGGPAPALSGGLGMGLK